MFNTTCAANAPGTGSDTWIPPQLLLGNQTYVMDVCSCLRCQVMIGCSATTRRVPYERVGSNEWSSTQAHGAYMVHACQLLLYCCYRIHTVKVQCTGRLPRKSSSQAANRASKSSQCSGAHPTRHAAFLSSPLFPNLSHRCHWPPLPQTRCLNHCTNPRPPPVQHRSNCVEKYTPSDLLTDLHTSCER